MGSRVRRLPVAKSKLIVADPDSGKSTMYEMNDDQFRVFKGLKIGGKLDGSTVGVEGTLKITGGSDSAGFPMRSDVLGGVKKYVLLTKGVGFRTNEKGLKRRKLVRGNTITEEIYQINAVLTSKPKKTKKETTPEAAKEEAPTEKKPPAPKETKEPAKREESGAVKSAKKEKVPPKPKTPNKTEEQTEPKR